MAKRRRLRRAALAVDAAGVLALPYAVHAADRHDDRGDRHRECPHRDDDLDDAPNIYYIAPLIVHQPPDYEQPEPFPTLTLPF